MIFRQNVGEPERSNKIHRARPCTGGTRGCEGPCVLGKPVTRGLCDLGWWLGNQETRHGVQWNGMILLLLLVTRNIIASLHMWTCETFRNPREPFLRPFSKFTFKKVGFFQNVSGFVFQDLLIFHLIQVINYLRSQPNWFSSCGSKICKLFYFYFRGMTLTWYSETK